MCCMSLGLADGRPFGAVVAGALLDLVNQVGWWIMASVIGKNRRAGGLADLFVSG